jgi:phosphatidylglycerophosphatase A
MKGAKFFYTACYAGYLPLAPGTAGTAVGTALYFIERLLFGNSIATSHFAVTALFFFPALILCGIGERELGRKDPPEVVLDEVIGFWISMLFHPFSIARVLIAFIVFRTLDVIKPWPVNRAQSLPGGWGVLFDDCIAGVYTNIILIIISYLFKLASISI